MFYLSVLTLLLSTGIWLRWLFTSYQGISGDAADFAQIARHIVRGHSFQTSILRPMRLAWLEDISGPHPDVTRQPLYSLFVAFFFRVFGINDRSVVFASGFAYVMTCMTILWMGTLVFNPTVGIISALFTITNYELLTWSVSGYSETLLAWLWTLTILVLLSTYPPVFLSAFLAGVLLGLCYLTRANLILAFVPFALVGFISGHITLSIGIIGGFILVSFPWWCRNWRIAKDPFFTDEKAIILFNIAPFPGETLWQRLEKVNLRILFQTYLKLIWQKVQFNFLELSVLLPRVTPLWLFTLISLFFPWNSPFITASQFVCFFAILIQIPLFLLIHPYTRYFVPFVPCSDLFGVAFILSISSILHLPLYYPISILFLILLISGKKTWHGLRDPRHKYRILASNLDNAYSDQIKLLKGSGVIVSDIPWAVAWHADCESLLLPINPYTACQIESSGLKIGGFYFSAFMNWWPSEIRASWPFYGREAVEQFYLGTVKFKLAGLYDRKEYCDNRVNPVFYEREV